MDNFNLASWNVKGVNKKEKQDVVVEFCSKNKIGIKALLETKLKDNKVKEMMDSPTIERRLLIIWRR